MSDTLRDQIIEQVDALPLEERRRVLDFARALTVSAPAGGPGQDLRRFAGMFDAEDANRMAEAIEDGCERADPDEWGRFLLDTNIVIALSVNDSAVLERLEEGVTVFLPFVERSPRL